jgi:hypothetical protein
MEMNEIFPALLMPFHPLLVRPVALASGCGMGAPLHCLCYFRNSHSPGDLVKRGFTLHVDQLGLVHLNARTRGASAVAGSPGRAWRAAMQTETQTALDNVPGALGQVGRRFNSVLPGGAAVS